MFPPGDYNPPVDVGAVQYSVDARRISVRDLGVPKEKRATLMQK